MGPSIAMRTAAQSLVLAGRDPLYEVDMDELQGRLAENLGDD